VKRKSRNPNLEQGQVPDIQLEDNFPLEDFKGKIRVTLNSFKFLLEILSAATSSSSSSSLVYLNDMQREFPWSSPSSNNDV
jgi:hypothetical protein